MSEISDLVSDVVAASKLPAKARATSIKPTVAKLTEAVYEHGVLPDDLTQLVDLITSPSLLDQASLASLVKNLYPIGKVTDETVVKIIGCLGHGKLKPSLTIQSLLIKWLIMVYHQLESRESLSQTYAVLFNLLDTAALRNELCHLLAMITRRKHVRPFRIQAILNLSRQFGSDPRLVGLLRVYKNYYPEVIVGEATRGRAAPFKHPDLEWRTRLDEIQTEHQQWVQLGTSEPRDGFKVNSPLKGLPTGRHAMPIPRVLTSHVQEESVTLEEIDSAEKLVQNLEKIELPNQLVAVLADPLLQKLLLLRPGDDARRRVNNWITDCVQEAAHDDGKVLSAMLEPIHRYTVQTKTFDPIFTEFFSQFFKKWDGLDQKTLVLETLSHVPLASFQPLYESTFAPLEAKLLDNSPKSQLTLLNFYTTLLRNWSISILHGAHPITPAGETITLLAEHISTLSLTLALTSPTTTTHISILSFYETLAHLFTLSTPLQRTTLAPNPPPTLVFTLHFSASSAVLSRLCAFITRYKKIFESYTRHHTPRLSDAARDHINTFNGFIMDMCNCLWRERGLSATDQNTLGCALPRALSPELEEYVKRVDRDLKLPMVFGLSHSPVLCLQAAAHLRGLEDVEAMGEEEGMLHRHAGPVTARSLERLAELGGLELSYNGFRSGVLEHLEEQGLGGIQELLINSMKNLKRPGA